MKCLRKFEWVKLPRAEILDLKGRMGYWLKLASRAAFRKGTSRYCGHDNPVEPGMWAGGIVGLRSILGVRSRQKALQIMDELQDLGYLTWTLDADTKKGWLKLQMPILLPRKEKSSRSYIRGFLYPALEQFAFSRVKIRYRNCVLIFRHVYDRNRPEREYRDHDNIELNTVVDAIAMFFLVDDTPL